MIPPRMPANWPNHGFARRVTSPSHDWCVLDIGSGPVILLLHGAGGSGHSFRNLIPLLTLHYRVIVPDLPGQGFTRVGRRGRLGLDAMAADLGHLCAAQNWTPAIIIGHSAGAAVALRMAETNPVPVIGINAALGLFEGAAGVLFPLMAKLLSMVPMLPSLLSKLWGTAAKVDTLLASTGSQIDATGRAQYLTLVRDTAHIEGTLGMMAQWQLDGLLARLPTIITPVLLVASSGDLAVPASISVSAAARLPMGTVKVLPRLGHLAHEEAADEIAKLVLPWIAEHLGTSDATALR